MYMRQRELYDDVDELSPTTLGVPHLLRVPETRMIDISTPNSQEMDLMHAQAYLCKAREFRRSVDTSASLSNARKACKEELSELQRRSREAGSSLRDLEGRIQDLEHRIKQL